PYGSPPDPSCLDATLNIQWYNPILSYYLPQRSFVFGAAMVMAVLLLLTPPLVATPFFRWRETIATIRSSWPRWMLKSEAVAFLAANLARFQPWDWDNSKLLVFWYMASAVAVGAVLVRLARAHLVGAIVAAVIWLSLVASGVLSLLQFLPPQGPAYAWFSDED